MIASTPTPNPGVSLSGLSNQKFFNVPEAAAFIRVSDKSIRRLINKGRIRFVPFGTRIVIDRDDLIGFMEGLKTTKGSKVINTKRLPQPKASDRHLIRESRSIKSV